MENVSKLFSVISFCPAGKFVTMVPDFQDPSISEIIRSAGIDPADVLGIDLVSERHGHRIRRIVTRKHSYVLKWFPDAAGRVEIEAYGLLRRIGVPTLPLFAHTEQALLLEDLFASKAWRLASAEDAAKPEVGRAVAEWYRSFHMQGERFLAEAGIPPFLKRETDILSHESILIAGNTLGLSDDKAWRMAAVYIDSLKAAVESQPVTLNYNDFHWTNLALSRPAESDLEAIVFDYHLLGIGMRFSDCRNVTGSLSGAAVAAFWEVYGPIDPIETLLDRPLAHLHSLVVAAGLPAFPRWADESRARLLDGRLEADLATALELLRT